ncbi:MAG: hypothetical protein AAB255_05750 [Bacteroidota bacterium]
MENTLIVTNNQIEFLHFIKAKYPIYHLSNLFFRDLHYGVKEFLDMKQCKLSYTDSEKVAREVAQFYETKNIFKKIDKQSWVLLYPEFSLKKS